MKVKDISKKSGIAVDTLLEKVVKDILKTIGEERERQIISHRLGLFDQKRTLEKIGQYLNLTRERIRQLEKSAIESLQSSQAYLTPRFKKVEDMIVEHLREAGNVVRVHDLADKMIDKPVKAIHQTQIIFVAKLSPKLIVIDENEHHHAGVTLAEFHDSDETIQHIEAIIDHIEDHGQPIKIHRIQRLVDKFGRQHVHGLATLSKKLAFLNDVWGLHNWARVNPRTITDYIYLVLEESEGPLHFSEIADRILNSSFSRKAVTTQAIHNALIKHTDFVLVGRGLYDLRSRGCQPGTVAEVIQRILEEGNNQPMEREAIVKKVLESRKVKVNTINLNLQSKPQFRRIAGTTKYVLAPSKSE